MSKRKKNSNFLQKSIPALILLLIASIFTLLTELGIVDINQFLPSASSPTMPQGNVEGVLTVHYIDVGQADSILLSCNGEYMLIDAGDRNKNLPVVHYLDELGVESLKYVVGTHPHSDHMGDMDEIFKNFEVDTLWTPVLSKSAQEKVFMKDMLAAAEAQNVYPTQPELGQTYQLGDATILMLGPVKYDYENENDLSLVLLVQFGKTRFIFTGDMEKDAEKDMLDYWDNDSLFFAQVLKLGHHGSDTSTGYRFLRAVDPTYGVISVGTGNQYGHPKQETIDILGDAEVLTYRTDYLGSIVATSDGTDITFSWTNTSNEPYMPD